MGNVRVNPFHPNLKGGPPMRPPVKRPVQMLWFVWLKNIKGGYDPQLWSYDHADCHREIAERIAQKIKLPLNEQNITLAHAVEKYPQPVPVR